MIKLQKPRSFYPDFERKDTQQKATTYCPGCGHGIVHKLIARAIDELGIQDRTIMLSPVGCSVFLYYYFDTGNVQCSHGRAPAVATGLRRSLKDAIIVCYQGDGDLAGIGTTEIIHAANRGENITVFFINNAIYGMTGGQMAPTTLLGQKTATTPDGRSVIQDGGPIGMAEVMNALNAPVYIERVSLASPAKILAAQKAIKRGLANQVEKRGFSFVEILSPCPVNWKMEPIKALEWIAVNLEPAFPVKIFRDNAASAVPQADFGSKHPWLNDAELLALLNQSLESPVVPRHAANLVSDQYVKISGFGGQGVLSAGSMLAKCAVAEGLTATWLPSYGAEMRGGTANTSVIISSGEIGSPVVNSPNVLLALNGPSLDLFEEAVRPGGLIIVNESIISRKVRRSDVTALYVPASELAKKEGFLAGANSAMLTAYIIASKTIALETLRSLIPLSVRKKSLADLNLKIVESAGRFYRENIAPFPR
ncbi:MAG: 2-oxoacid:acceptor oxidoreductase family protein [Chitinispirillaceae bacterium]|nr:2-oxoacid:acceptor oxidoreductase family protein [Chitinispirillaceae bacterium]